MEQHDEHVLRELFRSVQPDVTLPHGLEERLGRRLMDAARAAHDRQERPSRRRRLRYWLLRAVPGTAAVTLVAISVWLLLGEGMSTASADFAEMLKHVRQASTVTYNMLLRAPGEPDMKVRVLMKRPGRTRFEWPDGRIHIHDDNSGYVLRLSPDSRTANLVPIAGDSRQDDPLDQLQRVDVSAGRFMGREKIGGLMTNVYEIPQPHGEMRIFVDPRGNVPVRIESRSRLDDGSGFMTILEDFSWDELLPDSAFSLAIPPEYTIESSAASEQSLIELLRICLDMNNGLFPPKLDTETVVGIFLNGLQAGGGGEEVFTRVTPGVGDIKGAAKARLQQCLRGLAFVEKARKNGSWGYAGEGVRSADPPAVVCWWKARGSTSYRAIHSDLRIRDVNPEQLPLRRERSHTDRPTDDHE